VADYGNDTSWRAGVCQMHPSRPGPAQVGVTTHEAMGLLGMSLRTDASIDRVEAGRLLTWHAHDRQKQLRGSRLVEPTGQGTCRFTEVVGVRLLGLLRPLAPLVAWLLQRQATADLRRLKHLLETPPVISGPAPEETVTRGWTLGECRQSRPHTRPPSAAATLESQVLIASKASAGPSSAPPVLREHCAARVRATLVRGRRRPPPRSQDLTTSPLRACLSTTQDRWIQPLS
jgi:hypothetical protein